MQYRSGESRVVADNTHSPRSLRIAHDRPAETSLQIGSAEN
jgi:hypothetical protein